MSHKTSVIFQIFVEQFFSCKKWILSIYYHTNVTILNICLRISKMWGILAPDGGRNLCDHPTHWLCYKKKYIIVGIEYMVNPVLVLKCIVAAAWGSVLVQIVFAIKSRYTVQIIIQFLWESVLVLVFSSHREIYCGHLCYHVKSLLSQFRKHEAVRLRKEHLLGCYLCDH